MTIVVEDYDAALRFYVDVLGFDLAEDRPAVTNDGRAKRWVVVRSSQGGTGVLLARAILPFSARPWAIEPVGRVGFSCESTIAT